MRILTFSTLYPNSVQPRHGIFVEQRLRHLVDSTDVSATVVAPVPWFPFTAKRFGQYGEFARVPRHEDRHGIRIQHPRYPLLPKVGMNLAPGWMAAAVKPTLQRMINSGYDFDLIDAHYLYPDGVAATLLGEWLNKPVVMTARGSDVNVLPQYPRPREMILQACQRSAAIITVSRALRRALMDLGVAREKIHPLLNGVDLELFKPSNPGTDAWPSTAGKNLLSVGNLLEAKGHHFAIEALAGIPDSSLLIIGQGPYESELLNCAKTNGVSERVRILSNVAQHELHRYYSAADTVVLASYREGMPNVLLESLACGTPVVATRVGGIPEVICNETAGVLCDEHSSEALVRALQQLWHRMPTRQAVREYANRFDWQKTSEGQQKLFSRALAT